MSDSDRKKLAGPWWAWPFAISCFAIPVISLGGAIPAGLGVGGGFYCLAVSRESGKTTYRKLFHCAAAMTVAWSLFLALAGGMAILRTKAPGFFDPGHGRHASEPATKTPDANRSTLRGETVIANSSLDAPSDANGERVLDEATRRKIYKRAVSLRDDIAAAKKREREFRAKGMGDVPAKQLAHIQGMHEDRQEFTAKFFKISREELDAIVDEGDSKNWPRD